MSKYKDFDEYIRQGEPIARERSYAWKTAIGLQAVDGLRPSDYLLNTAYKHIEGDITILQAQESIQNYYVSRTSRIEGAEDTEEADRVSVNIARVLSEKTFAFTFVGLTSIHRQVFDGVFHFAGKIRDYNITKKEWVLDGETVLYVSAQDLKRAIEYDLEQEKKVDYTKLPLPQIVSNISKFVSDLWQIHPFGEGNTRTIAVFTIKYLRSMGFKVENELFANHSWYFRNALVRNNYQNVALGVKSTSEFLEKFFRNLLMKENNELKNRYMHISYVPEKHNNVTSDVTSDVTSYITPRQQQIVVDMLQNKNVSIAKLAENLGVTKTTINRDIKTLRAKGYIDRIGDNNYGSWSVLKNVTS
ncbi:MAG: HTH domain-containing protein [bacterium]